MLSKSVNKDFQYCVCIFGKFLENALVIITWLGNLMVRIPSC